MDIKRNVKYFALKMAETDINYEYFGIVWVSLLYIKKKKKKARKTTATHLYLMTGV